MVDNWWVFDYRHCQLKAKLKVNLYFFFWYVHAYQLRKTHQELRRKKEKKNRPNKKENSNHIYEHWAFIYNI